MYMFHVFVFTSKVQYFGRTHDFLLSLPIHVYENLLGSHCNENYKTSKLIYVKQHSKCKEVSSLKFKIKSDSLYIH